MVTQARARRGVGTRRDLVTCHEFGLLMSSFATYKWKGLKGGKVKAKFTQNERWKNHGKSTGKIVGKVLVKGNQKTNPFGKKVNKFNFHLMSLKG